MKIYLIRHALSLANDRGVWTGQLDVDLSLSGIKRQKEIMERFSYPEGELYFSSPLLRCVNSMYLIYGRSADFLLPELSECALGKLEGQPYTNLNDDVNYLDWLNQPYKSPPDGESFCHFTERVENGFMRVVSISNDAGAQKIVAMMHGNVMRAVLHRFAENSIPHSAWKIPNGGLYCLDIPLRDGKISSWRQMPDFLFK